MSTSAGLLLFARSYRPLQLRLNVARGGSDTGPTGAGPAVDRSCKSMQAVRAQLLPPVERPRVDPKHLAGRGSVVPWQRPAEQ